MKSTTDYKIKINALLLLIFFNLHVFSIEPTILRLNAEGNTMHHETAMYFDSAGTLSYDFLNDAPSLGTAPGYLTITSFLDNTDFQIKCLPLLNQNLSIPIKVTTGTSGNYQIYISNLQEFPAGVCLTIHDNQTHLDQNLRAGSYSCFINSSESSPRFILNITVSNLPFQTFLNFPNCQSGTPGSIIAQPQAGTGPWDYYWKDTINQIIRTTFNKMQSDTLNQLGFGNYKLEINTHGACNLGYSTLTLSDTTNTFAIFESTNSHPNIFENIILSNQSINANDFFWDFGDGNTSTDATTSHYYSTPGTYTITLSAHHTGCDKLSIAEREILVSDVTTGIDNKNSNSIKIGQNQSSCLIFLNYNTPQITHVKISDILGNEIIKITTRLVSSEKIDIPLYQHQLYMVQIQNSEGEYVSQKIIF